MQSQTRGGYFPSPQQRASWIAQQGVQSVLRIQAAVLLEGPIQPEQMQDAFRVAVARHEILRTVFHRQPGLKIPFQVVLDEFPGGLRLQDLTQSAESHDSSLEESLQAESGSFDFEKGPLFRGLLASRDPDSHLLTLTASPMIADVQSLRILVDEMLAQYAGVVNDQVSEPLRYLQFAQWQNDLLESDDDSAKEGKAFWSQRLKEAAEPVHLPFERKTQSAINLLETTHLVGGDLASKLEKIAADSATSVEAVVFSAWLVLLHRLVGSSDLTIAFSASGREYEELADAVGPIAKSIPLAVHSEADFEFFELVRSSTETVAQAKGWQEYFDPSADNASDPALSFQFSVLPEQKQFGKLRRAFVHEASFAAKHKLSLNLVHGKSDLKLQFVYDGSRFTRAAIDRIVGYFDVLLNGVAQSPQLAISRFPLLSESQRHQVLVEWNQTQTAYPQASLHQLFEDQAARVPDSPAVRCAESVLTYRELNEASNRLAHHLRKLGIGPDRLVGLFLNRSVNMMVAVLAILKAGGAYVPLNTDNPKSRLEQQLQDVAALITEKELRGNAPSLAGPVLCIDSDANKWASEIATNPDNPTTPENLVYVIYTSGSTGIPKGVAVRHRNLVNYSSHISRVLELQGDSPALQFATVSTLGADLGNTCIYPSLISGGCLHILPYEVATDAQQMAAYQDRYRLDVLKIVPSQLAALMNSPEGARILPNKYLITGGETLSRDLVAKIYASAATCEVINHYGPTETTVGSLTRVLRGFDWQGCSATTIPIGRPIANTRIYVLDAFLQPVPVGVAGELYIAGAGVAAGYLNQPERTNERFVPDPFFGNGNERMYRTGDLVRYVEDGNVEFLGRADDQVKVRGFRIELGEIEAALQRQSGVRQAFVIAQEDDITKEKQLVGYAVLDRDKKPSSHDLREALKSELPDYMVPPALMILDKLPLTSNGKVDRRALPKPGAELGLEKTFIPPKTPTERQLANIWVELLRRPQISSDDNFFDLGGHSLSGTQVISRVREQFRVEVALRTLFEKPTLSGLAAAIDNATESADSAGTPIQRVSRDAYRQAAKKQ